MSAFRDSPSNRLFAAFLSILLMIPTGWHMQFPAGRREACPVVNQKLIIV